jgi:hypothetical protein
MIRRAAIAYRDGELEAYEQGDLWMVRLANLEVRAYYLDLALAELLGNAPEAHRVAARLLAAQTEVKELQAARTFDPAPVARRRGLRATRRQRLAKPLVVSLRVLLFATVSTTAFMLTTWLTALR